MPRSWTIASNRISLFGYEVWRNKRQIRSGTDFLREIEGGLRSTQVVVALLSTHAVRASGDPTSPDDPIFAILQLAFADRIGAHWGYESRPGFPPKMVRCALATDAPRPLIGFGVKHTSDLACTSCRSSAASRRCWIYKQ